MNENLVSCRICEKKISNRAVVCPNCGEIYPGNKNGRKIMKVFYALEIGVIVFYILGFIAVMAIPYYIKSIFTF